MTARTTNEGESFEYSDVEHDEEDLRRQVIKNKGDFANMTETNDKSASMTIKAWICSAMQVDDEPQEGRIVISVGSLRFPVPYEVLASETDRMIMVQEGGDNAKYTSPKTIMGMSAQALKDASGPEFRRRIFIDKPKK